MVAVKTTHTILQELEYDDGVMTWGGRKVTDIAQQVGATPFYAFASSRMTQRVAQLRTAMPEDLNIHYAMKANPMPAVVKHMASQVDGLDVASAGELRVALDAGMDPQHISFAGPGKRDSELQAAVDAGIIISLESESEMRRLVTIGARAGRRPRVAVRVNPEFELKSSGMKMGGRPSPFGIDAEKVPSLLKELASLDLQFLGFHVYSGSQNLSAAAIEDALLKTTQLVIELAESTTFEVCFVNLGGGLGIPYFANDKPLNLHSLREPAQQAMEQLTQAFGRVAVNLELGRYLVGEAGIYVCRVVDLKYSRGTRYAICDGGLHHHLAASGNFGQVIRKNYPIAAVTTSKPAETVSVVGPLCTPLDILGNSVSLDALRVGSLIAVLQSGAYGRTASPERFLSHPPCHEILI